MEQTKCLIIGSGPAGYTAAIYASRANLNPIVYEGIEPGGQLTTTTEIENFPGYPEGIAGTAMMDDLKRQAQRFGADVRFGVVTDVDFTDFDEDTEIVQQVQVVEEQVEDDQPFLIAETMPKFQGGDLNAFRNWVQQNVKFPQIALENGIQGRVVLTFVIEKDGRLTNIVVLQTPDRSLSEEAIRVLNKSPKWSPGKQRNQVVRVKYTLPVDFRVQN